MCVHQTSDKQQDYNWSEDAALIEPFLKKVLARDPSIKERSQFLKQSWEKHEIKPEYIDLINTLTQLAWTTKNRKDYLHLSILQGKRNLDKGVLLNQIRSAMSGYGDDWLTFAQELTEIGQEINKRPRPTNVFKEALNLIADNFPGVARITADYLVDFSDMDSDRILLLRGNYRDEDYFYKEVERHWQIGTPESRNDATWLLTYGRKRDSNLYRERDFYYLEYVVKEKNQSAVECVLVGLVGYARVNKVRAFQLMADILENFDLERFGYLFDDMFSKGNESFQHEFRDDIRILIEEHTMKLSLNETDIINALHWLEQQFGFEVILNYFKKRYQYYLTRISDGLEWTDPKGFNRSKFDEQYKIDTFRRALEWYISDVKEKRHWQKSILNYFAFNHKESELLVEKVFRPIGEKSQNSTENLSDLAEIVHKWGVWKEPIARFLIQLAEWHVEITTPKVEDVRYILGSELLGTFFQARHGHKKEEIPQRFVEWHNLLKILKEEDYHPMIAMLLREAADESGRVFSERFLK